MTTAPEYGATLEEEQKYFNDVYDLREHKRHNRSAAYSAAGDNKARARLKANADRDTTLGSPEDPAAFLRIDTADGEHYYVANAAVTDAGVYSWKAPFIAQLRAASHEDPGDVVRFRRYGCKLVNEIVSIDDAVLTELAQRVRELEDGSVAVVEADRMLQDVLESERTPEMRDIVETIQAAQSALIGSDPDQLLIVQGGPGTGKTAVALHRLSTILYNAQAVSPSDVLVIGPNETFSRYIARVLPQLGDEDVEITDVTRMLGSRVVVSTKESSEAAKLKGDLRMVEVLRRGLADRVRVPQETLTFSVIGVPWRARVEPQLIRRLIDEQAVAPQNVGRNMFRERLKNAVVSQVRARMEGERLPVRGDLAMLLDATEIESAVDRIWPRLSPQAFLRELYGSLERLVAAAGSALAADEIRLLRRSAGSRVAEQSWSKEDLALLDEVAHLMGERVARYSHIVVDEAQDLSPLQVRAIARRSVTGAMTLVGDIAQSTGHWARDSWDDILDLIETSLPKHVQQLEFGYRVPRSVMELAARLLPIAAPGIEAPRVVREVANSVRVTEVGDSDDVAQRVVDLVREHSGYGRFVGVVCPDERRPEVAEAFRKSGLSWQDADKGSLGASINLVSPVASKGLEFDAVVVVDPQVIVDAGPEGFRMLYVAMTRTTKFLDIVHPEGALPVPLRDDEGAGVSAVEVDRNDETAHLDAGTATPPGPLGEQAGRPGGSRGRSSEASGFTPRQQKVIAREAEDLISSLEETVPAALWRAVLARAMDMLERE